MRMAHAQHLGNVSVSLPVARVAWACHHLDRIRDQGVLAAADDAVVGKLLDDLRAAIGTTVRAATTELRDAAAHAGLDLEALREGMVEGDLDDEVYVLTPAGRAVLAQGAA